MFAARSPPSGAFELDDEEETTGLALRIASTRGPGFTTGGGPRVVAIRRKPTAPKRARSAEGDFRLQLDDAVGTSHLISGIGIRSGCETQEVDIVRMTRPPIT
jgi:hypothetical protein